MKKAMARWFLAFLILCLVVLVIMAAWSFVLKGKGDALFGQIFNRFF